MDQATLSAIGRRFFLAEETESLLRDRYNRFIYAFSTERHIYRASVSRYFADAGLAPVYPGKAPFAVFLSHDIDMLAYSRKSLLRKAVLYKSPRYAAKAFSASRRDPDLDVRILLDIEKELGIQATYFFLSLRKTDEDFSYHPSAVSDILRTLKANGHEAGLHGGHLAYNDAQKIKTELLDLEAAAQYGISSYRNHYLRFDSQITWPALAQHGFAYDATLGFSDSPGFRNGTCHPFPAFDIRNSTILPMLAQPLHIMDLTLFEYLRLDMPQALAICKTIIQEVKAVGGVLGLLWHNTFITGAYLDFYRRLLDHLLSEGAWISSGENIAAHWKANAYDKFTASLYPALNPAFQSS